MVIQEHRGMIAAGVIRDTRARQGLFYSVATATVVFLHGAGCNSEPHGNLPKAPVSVVVTNAGEPVTAGDVSLSNYQTGQGGGGSLDAAGRATIAAVPLGEYTATVTPIIEAEFPGGPTKAVATQPPVVTIPPKARNPKTSPFRITVQKGMAEIHIDLSEAR
jgi:hypothetical protein